MRSLGIFGGSFDPIHNGHVEIVKSVLQQSYLDEVIVLPCYQSPFKESKSELSDTGRLELIELALQSVKSCKIDDSELRHKESSYSYKAVEHYKCLYPRDTLYWILGTDQWEFIEDWKNADYLKEVLSFIVVTRQEEVVQKQGWKMKELHLDAEISSTAIRKMLKQQNWANLSKVLPRLVFERIKELNYYQ